MSNLILPPFNLAKCDPVCTKCVEQYNEKYGSRTKVWKIPCTGIPLEYIPASILEGYSEAEQQNLIASVDPVTWAKVNFGWEARWYQKEMLRCTSRRKASRTGRQIGKTEVLVIFALFQLFTKLEFRALVIAPYKVQVDLLFDRMSTFLRRSPGLDNAVVRNVKGPHHEIELASGSTVLGLSSGAKSGGEANSARGQPVPLLLFDEADYLGSKDLDSAIAGTTNFPDATVWASSTPTGRREKFWQFCQENEGYKEFHFPSHVNPHWTQEIDEQFKREFTQLGYLHEILGLFGEQAEGVYQRQYVEAALTDYGYETQKPEKGWIYCVGVDWNDTEIGTRIVVVGQDPASLKFRVVAKYTVSRAGWTMIAAMKKIKEVNIFWRPAYIYVDQGYGAGQIEMLHYEGARALRHPDYGPNHPDSKLRDIVKGFHFGGKVETYDPITMAKISRPAKAYLVENSQRYFEHGFLEIPATDQDLQRQLLGYIVARVTQSGQPVYEAQNKEAGDHDIDALNLALLAFTMEYQPLGKPRFSANVSFIGKSLNEIVEQGNMPKGDETNIYSVQVIREQKKKRLSEQRKESAPSERSLESTNLLTPAIPGKTSGPVRIWSWPGFERDMPRPERKAKSRRGGLFGKRNAPSRRAAF